MMVTYLLPDGGQRDVSRGIPEHEFAGLYGQMLADALVSAEMQGVFDDLDKASNYKLDVEEFDGAWAWET
jgi:hypothetical protein